MSEKIRVMLIDDHMHIHDAVSTILELVDDIELIAQGSNGLEALELCKQFKPDLILMDMVMPKMNGIEATKAIKELYPQIRILALSSFQDRPSIRAVLTNGAIGYILKDEIGNDLEGAIRLAARGKSVFSDEITENLLKMSQQENQNQYELTPREIEILGLMAKGMHNHEIADNLVISYSTVRFHISNIINKMDVKTRAEATALAAKEGLLP